MKKVEIMLFSIDFRLNSIFGKENSQRNAFNKLKSINEYIYA